MPIYLYYLAESRVDYVNSVVYSKVLGCSAACFAKESVKLLGSSQRILE